MKTYFPLAYLAMRLPNKPGVGFKAIASAKILSHNVQAQARV
jgi:hypothetical protein